MKRFLALLLTLVMLVSVCGLQAFAADGDTTADTGDELVVYTRSGIPCRRYIFVYLLVSADERLGQQDHGACAV